MHGRAGWLADQPAGCSQNAASAECDWTFLVNEDSAGNPNRSGQQIPAGLRARARGEIPVFLAHLPRNASWRADCLLTRSYTRYPDRQGFLLPVDLYIQL